MQASQSLLRKDPTWGYRTNSAVRRSLPESEMRAVLMLVANILREQSLEMPFIHRDNVVQQVSSAAFDPTLRHTVLPGTLEGRADRAYLQGSNGRRNLQPVFRIPVENQKPGR